MAPEMVRGWSRRLSGQATRSAHLQFPLRPPGGGPGPGAEEGKGGAGGQIHPWTGSQGSQGLQFADNERESYLNAPGAQGPLTQAREPPPAPPQARVPPPPPSCPPAPFTHKTLGAG